MTSLTHLGELSLLRHAVVGCKVHRFDEVECSHVDLEHSAMVAMGDVGVLEILVRELSSGNGGHERSKEVRRGQRRSGNLSRRVEIEKVKIG